MSITLKYAVLGLGKDERSFIDFALAYGAPLRESPEIQYLGSSYVEALFVRPGATYWLSTGSGADRIYFEGAFADYTLTSSASTLQLTRETGGLTETVRLSGASSPLAPDVLVFADGSVSANDTYRYVRHEAALPVPSGETSLAPAGAAAPDAELSASVKVAIFDPDGGVVAPPEPGVRFTVLGNSGSDRVYVSEGAQIDASSLGGGMDIVHFTGNWADYAKVTMAADMTLTRMIGGVTESVVVAASGGSRNDLLVFADGAVRSQPAGEAIRADPDTPIAAIPSYDPMTVTGGGVLVAPEIGGFLDPFASEIDAQGNVIHLAVTEVAGAAVLQPGGTSLHGTATPGSTITLTLGGQIERDLVADADGAWSLALSHAELVSLGIGEMTAEARVTDGAGQIASSSATLTINAQAYTSSAIAPAGYGSAYVDALVVGEAGWRGGTITYAFAESGGASDWSEAEKQAARKALQTYADIADLIFEEGGYYGDAARDANIVFSKVPAAALPGTGTLAEFSIPFGDLAGMGSDVNLTQTGRFNYQSVYWQNLEKGSLGFDTLVHEIGHGLGLAHSFSTVVNGAAQTTFPGVTAGDAYDLGDFDLSQGVWSVMAYNLGWNIEPPPGDRQWGLPETPMVFDVAAIQALYGANMSHRIGDDVYLLPQENAAGTGWACIWDAGGIDTISNAGGTQSCVINLNAYPLSGGIQSTLYVSGNLAVSGGYTVASGAVIENAIGGGGADVIVGNAAANVMTGGAGADSFCFIDTPDASALDQITDFAPGEGDRIVLSSEAFGALEGMSDLGAAFAYFDAGTPQDATILYDANSGALHYNASGSGGKGIVFATLANRPQDLGAASFVII